MTPDDSLPPLYFRPERGCTRAAWEAQRYSLANPRPVAIVAPRSFQRAVDAVADLVGAVELCPLAREGAEGRTFCGRVGSAEWTVTIVRREGDFLPDGESEK